MSIQDDIFDLEDSLDGESKKAFHRIMEFFHKTENELMELEKLQKIVEPVLSLIHNVVSAEITRQIKDTRPIPISAAKRISEEYGYDQVVIIARAVDECEHVTTYGKDPVNCDIAARIGNLLKYKVMGWVKEEEIGHDNAE